MCGIVGYLGKKLNSRDIVKVLSKLEYRGYDSAGIAGINEDGLSIVKEVGAISNLQEKLSNNWEIFNAIAHTRWSTHGVSSQINAHPHQSFDKKWTLVHNGIIENCDAIKSTLVHDIQGETDTEILVEYIAEMAPKNFKEFVELFENIKGSYAVICQHADSPQELYIAKKDSPLYLAQNEEGDILLASDPICFVEFSDSYITFNNDEFAHIQDKKVEFVSKDFSPIQKEKNALQQDTIEYSKQHYQHYMLKEIYEQPFALKRQIEVYTNQKILEKFTPDFLSKFTNIKLLGCGTAYHACMMGAKYLEKITHIPASAEIASEFYYNDNALNDETTLFIFVSQSGETADTINVLNLEKSKNATTIAVTNVTYSTLAQKADYILPICAGPEISVASTKAYMCQISALYLLAQHFNNPDSTECFEEIKQVSENLFNFDIGTIDKIADYLLDKKDVIFIGKDLDFVTARESALKMKEITYINSNASPSGELKHGYLALIYEGLPVIAIATNPKTNGKTLNSASEACARCADLITVSNEELEGKFTIKVADAPTLLMPLITIVPMQYLAYRLSVLKGINADKPRNLAKSVTVE